MPSLGSGTSVGHGVIVNAGARVGDYCILSNSLIEHDAVIGDYCHVSTGVFGERWYQDRH